MKQFTRKSAAVKMLSCIMAICLLLTACAQAGSKTTVTVNLFDAEQAEIFSTDISVTGDAPTAEDAIIEACKSKSMAYTFTDGMFDNFNGIASTDEDGWILYINGELSEVGAADCILEEGMVIDFKYVNYAQVFNF